MTEEELMRALNGHYGASYVPEGRLILRKGKLFLYAGEDTKLDTVWAGLHIGNDDLSLSIEGAQKLGTTASLALTVTKDEADRYYAGEDLPGHEGEGHVILKTRDRVIGPGRLDGGEIRNTLPHSRKTRQWGDRKK